MRGITATMRTLREESLKAVSVFRCPARVAVASVRPAPQRVDAWVLS